MPVMLYWTDVFSFQCFMTVKQLLGVLLAELWFCILPGKMHPSKTETVTKFMIE